MNTLLPSACVIVLFLTGCYDRDSDAKWRQTIPGVYEGDHLKSGFREIIDIKSNNVFNHTVIIGGKTNLTEYGKWKYGSDRGVSLLFEPFTSFFDKDSRKISNQGNQHTMDVIFVMRYGTAAERISPDVYYEYCLYKRK